MLISGTLARDIDKMCPSPPTQISPSYWHWTLQVYYLELDVSWHVRRLQMASEKQQIVCLQWTSSLKTNSCSNPVILSLYWSISALRPVARTAVRHGKWSVSPLDSCVSQSDSFNLNARMLSLYWVTFILRPCNILLRLFRCWVISTIKAKSCTHCGHLKEHFTGGGMNMHWNLVLYVVE